MNGVPSYPPHSPSEEQDASARSSGASRLALAPGTGMQRRQYAGRGVMSALASAIVLMLLVSLFLLGYGTEIGSRLTTIALMSSCLLVIGCLAVVLAHLGRDSAQYAAELQELNRLLHEENNTRHQAEQQLRGSEQMFRQLAENSLDMVCGHTADGTFTYVSPVSVKLLGIEPHMMVGRSPLEFWQLPLPSSGTPLESTERTSPLEKAVDTRFADALRASGNNVLLFPYSHPSGSQRWLEVVAHPVLDEQGTGLQGWQSRVSDVSGRVQEGAKEHQLVVGLRAITDATDELIAISDESQLLRRAVELAREKLGVERGRLFLASQAGNELQATFGTGPIGMTTDERNAPVPVITPWREDPHVPRIDERWRLLGSQPLWYWDGRKWQTLREGWLAATLVMAGKEPLGVFYHDSALTGKPYDTAQQQLISVYCSLLGALIARQRTEASLFESQRQLSAVMQNAPLFLYAVDTEERFTLAMGSALSYIGLSADEMIGSHLTDILQPGDPTIARIRRVLSGETISSMSQFSGRHLQMLRQPTYNADGHISGMMGIGVDITERVEAEKSLQDSRERYRGVVNSLKEVVFQTDAEGHWTFLNPSWTEILGWSQTDSLGQPFSRFVLPTDHALLDQEFALLVTGRKESTRHTMRYMTSGGGVRWLEVYARLLKDESGLVIGTTGTLNDVTERHRAEEQLQATTALQEAILSGVNYAIVACDSHGKMQLFNRAAERMFGYDAAEVIGADGNELIREIFDPHELATQTRTLGHEVGELIVPGFSSLTYKALHGLPEEHDWTFVRRDESRFPGRLSVSALRDEDGQAVGFVGIIYDLTESKRIEHLKNEFVSVVSHELRTPLTSIRGSLGLLEGGVAGPLPSSASKMIGIAQKNVERLVVLINDILDIEKIESGKMRFEMSEVSLRELLRAATEQNRAYGNPLGVRLNLEALPPALDNRLVCADEGRLMQVFSNLISNAMKFTPSGGTVKVSVEARGRVTEGKGSEWVRIKISDQGQGVPEAFVPQLFERFAQAEESATRSQGGTGLGLAIARAIVEKHGGRIGYLPPDSTQSERPEERFGSTFYFDLELMPGSEIVPELPKVLVCEDDPEVAQLLRLLLEDQGYVVEVAPTLARTRELLSSGQRFHLLMFDIMLPDGMSLDLLAELQEDSVHELPPIVVVSAYCEEGKLRGDAIGVSDWIEKPLDPSRIMDAIQRVSVRNRNNGRPRLLHIEDDADVRQIIQIMLNDRADVVAATTLAEARAHLAREDFDLALLDIGLPDGSGLTLLPVLSAQKPPIPVVLFSARDEGEGEKDVFASLTKSRTSNAELRATIERLLPPMQGE